VVSSAQAQISIWEMIFPDNFQIYRKYFMVEVKLLIDIFNNDMIKLIFKNDRR
jgi:hypothetical protein